MKTKSKMLFALGMWIAGTPAVPLVASPAASTPLTVSAPKKTAPVSMLGETQPPVAWYGDGKMAVAPVLTTVAAVPVFIENQGQFDPHVKFQVNLGGRTAWLTGEGIVFDVTRPAAGDAGKREASSVPTLASAINPVNTLFRYRPVRPTSPVPPTLDRLVFAEDLVATHCCSKVEGKEIQPGTFNYFRGDDASKWRTNVRGFAEVIYRDVWRGIDLRVYANGSNLEQEFIVRPGGDLTLVRVAYRGVGNLSIAKDGSLEVATSFGVLRETKPRIFQQIDGERETVEGHYKLTSKTSYTFEVQSLNPLYALVIDPTLLFSTYIGGSGRGNGSAGVAVDAAGNAYMGGYTLTNTYPTTVGAFQTSCPSSYNCNTAVVSKFDPVGRLQYSTYLSGSTGDYARAIAVNSNGEAYITGDASPGFPTTASAFQTTCGGVFMAKLNSTGTALVYSTCLGGGGQGVGARGIALDTNGRAYLTGSAYTPAYGGYPVTSGALQPTPNGTSNAYVSIVDPSLSGAPSLVYSTWLGGSGSGGDLGFAIAADSYGNAYVAGRTFSRDFPVTPNAYQTSNPYGTCNYGDNLPIFLPCQAAFVAKINPRISGRGGLIYSTYLTGTSASNNGGDVASAIAVDPSGNAYVAGAANSSGFPTTKGAFQTAPTTGSAFVTKLSATGGSLLFSTLLVLLC